MDPLHSEDEDDKDLDTPGESNQDSDESLDNDKGEDNTPAKSKKNKSNWKSMKAELKRLQGLEKAGKLAPKADDDDSDEDDSDEDFDDEDDDDDAPISARYTPMALKIKFLEDPEAKKYEEAIRGVFKRYPDMKFADAKALAKASNEESTTKRPIGLKSNASKPKGIESLSEEEAMKLEPAEFLEWGRKTGKIKG